MGKVARTIVLVIGVVALLLFCLAPSKASAAGLGVAPAEIQLEDVLRGSEHLRSIRVFNSGDEGVSAQLNANGEATDWISFCNPDVPATTIETIAVPAKGRAEVWVKFKIPQDAAEGTYTATICVEAIVGEEEELEGTHQSVGLQVMSSVIIKVTGTQTLSGNVGGISVMDIEVGYPLRIMVEFANTGNVVATPLISVKIATQDGTTINNFTSSEFNVKPEKHETIPLEWDTTGRDPGDYIADVSVVLGDAIIKQEQLNFSILPVGMLTRSGSLTELKFGGESGLGVLTVIRATFINTGQIDIRAKFVGEVYHNDTLIDTLQGEELLVATGNIELLKAYFRPDQQGEYRIKGYVIYEGKKTEEKEISFTITKAGEVGHLTNAVSTNVGNSEQTFDFSILAVSVIGALIIIVTIFMILRSRRES